jgi:hypothetical protein
MSPRRRSIEIPGKMSAALRRAVYAVVSVTWLSGALWLLFHYFLFGSGEFGQVPNPLEHWWLRLHGLAAFAFLWLCGVLWTRHVRLVLDRPKRRPSGYLLVGLLAVLIATGYLLYYASDDAVRQIVGIAHWVCGLALIVPLTWHIVRAKSAGDRN